MAAIVTWREESTQAAVVMFTAATYIVISGSRMLGEWVGDLEDKEKSKPL